MASLRRPSSSLRHLEQPIIIPPLGESEGEKASVLMQRLSYLSETLLSNMINRNRIVLSFKDSP